jgi:hypothetical protein
MRNAGGGRQGRTPGAPAVSYWRTVLATSLIAAMAAGPVDGLAVESPPAVPIVGGTEVPLGRWDAVGAFQIGVRFCSGTMVAPRVMLTAAHCLTAASPEAPENIVVGFGPSAYTPVAYTRAAGFGIFEQFCSECTRDRFDLGYVLLQDSVTLPEGFPPLITDQPTWDAAMVDGTPLVAVGYGQNQDGDPSPGDDKGVGIKREVGLEYRSFSDSGLDFRAGGGGLGTCGGDSGGPAFVEVDDGVWAIAGVLSGGFGACGEGGLFIVPLPALPWIRDETGVDLLPPDCANADCVDTSLSSDGCGCRHGGRATFAGWMVLLLLLAHRRGSRRSLRGPATC